MSLLWLEIESSMILLDQFFFSFWNQQKKKVTSLREREKDIYFGDH